MCYGSFGSTVETCPPAACAKGKGGRWEESRHSLLWKFCRGQPTSDLLHSNGKQGLAFTPHCRNSPVIQKESPLRQANSPYYCLLSLAGLLESSEGQAVCSLANRRGSVVP